MDATINMQTNLSSGDIVLSLLLGVAGSLIAAYLLLYGPRWFAAVSNRWAERSRKSANAKIKKLKEEQHQIDILKKDPAKLVGWTSAKLSRGLLFSMTAVLLVLISFASKADYSLEIILAKLGLRDGPSSFAISDPKIVDIILVASNFTAGILAAVAAVSFLKVIQYGDIDGREKHLEEEIRKLQRKAH